MDDAASKNFPWPNASQLGDPLRAMVVCGTGQFSQPKMVWDKIHASFDVREGHGHVKPNFLVSNRPMDMLINIVIEVDGCMPVFGEIQVHYRPILDLKVCRLCFRLMPASQHAFVCLSGERSSFLLRSVPREDDS